MHAGIAPEILVTVHMGTSPFPALSSDELASLEKQYDIPVTATPIILTVGAIKERKGQLVTLRATEILRRGHPKILYIVAGMDDAAYLSEMERFIEAHDMQKNVRFVHDANDQALAYLYSACDVFALNSNTDEIQHHFEGFGLVIIEAAQFGKPAVGSHGSGIEDAIQDGKTGFLTRQGDATDVAEKIGRILERYAFFSGNAKLFHAAFNWSQMVSTYIKYYKES